MRDIEYYYCEVCGNLVEGVQSADVGMMCCGRRMNKLVPGTVEASREKHLPEVRIEGDTVKVTVGAVLHPMTENHSIKWIALHTDKGSHRIHLSVTDSPEATFTVPGEKPLKALAYCDLHGLWQTDIYKEPVCDLKPVNTDTSENYTVCKCNNVSYFAILDEVHKHSDLNDVLQVFENVKNTTHCSTGCGGCYDRVVAIISDAISKGI